MHVAFVNWQERENIPSRWLVQCWRVWQIFDQCGYYQSTPDWANVQPLASLSLGPQPNGLSPTLLATVKSSVTATADAWLSQIASSACRIPNFGFGWGSNSTIANQGVGLLYAYIITKDTKYIKGRPNALIIYWVKMLPAFPLFRLMGVRHP